MEIKELGEFKLIEWLTKDIKPTNPSTIKGVGDDAAVLRYSDKEVLVSSHLFMEGIQFDLTYIDMKHLAYKCAMVAMTNIFAMNGQPCQIIVSIGMGKRINVTDLDQFYDGLKTACSKWNVDIVGGDTTSSYTGLSINITCIGESVKEDIVYRKGATPTDIICVSGDLGAAYMGLQILEREKTVYYQQVEEFNKKLTQAQKENDRGKLEALNNERAIIENFQPDFAGKVYLIDRQLKPEAPGEVLKQLRNANIRPTSMIDVSDGLASDLKHLCKESNVGCRIYEDKIPIDYQTAAACEEFNMNLTTAALNGGEDYELLFTIPISEHAKITSLKNIHQIGYVTESKLGEFLIARDGNEFQLTAQGWI